MTLRIIGGDLGGRQLRVPPGRAVRPTTDKVREALFNILGRRVEGRMVFDLFAGSGALGIEALSRAARHAVFVERHARHAALIRRNHIALGVEDRATVVIADVFEWVRHWDDWPSEPALVLLDPPYAVYQRRPQRLVALVCELQRQLPGGTIIALEHDSGFDVSNSVTPGRWDVRRYGHIGVSVSVMGQPNAEVAQSTPEGIDPHARRGARIAPTDLGDKNSVTLRSQERFARHVVTRLERAGFRALWAGGCVRDRLLGRVPEDYDVATDARPEEVRDLFGRRRTIPVGAAFGVVEVLGPRDAGKVQVATFRSDLSYSDGRHPDQVQFGGAEADAQRRDFTINGMFYDPTREQVLDYVGGRQDLQARIVRAIGDPEARFAEDKLRLLRAVRFAATLGFTLEPGTHKSVCRLAAQIEVVSAERVAEELRRMLVHPRRAAAIQLAFDTGLVEAVLPELAPMRGAAHDEPTQPGDLWDHTLLVLDKLDESWHAVGGRAPAVSATPLPFSLAFATLLHDVGKPATLGSSRGEPRFHDHEHKAREITESICRRLKLSNSLSQRVCWLVEHHTYLRQAEQLRPATLKRILIQPGIDELLALHGADALASTGDTSSVRYCLETLRNMPEEQLNPPALLSGHDLIRHGVPRGPVYSSLLDAVRDAQLDGQIRTKREALSLVDRLLERQPASDGMESRSET